MLNELLIKVCSGTEKVMSHLRDGLCRIPLIFRTHILTECPTVKRSIQSNFFSDSDNFPIPKGSDAELRILLFTSEFTLMPGVKGQEQPDCPVRTLSIVKGTQKSQLSVDHRSQNQFDSKLRHFSSQVSVSHYPRPPPRHITRASSASWIRVSEVSRKLFSPTRLRLFFLHTS